MTVSASEVQKYDVPARSARTGAGVNVSTQWADYISTIYWGCIYYLLSTEGVHRPLESFFSSPAPPRRLQVRLCCWGLWSHQHQHKQFLRQSPVSSVLQTWWHISHPCIVTLDTKRDFKLMESIFYIYHFLYEMSDLNLNLCKLFCPH